MIAVALCVSIVGGADPFMMMEGGPIASFDPTAPDPPLDKVPTLAADAVFEPPSRIIGDVESRESIGKMIETDSTHLGGLEHRQSITFSNLVMDQNGTGAPQRQLAEAMGTVLGGQGEIRIRMCNVGMCELTVNALAAITGARVWSTDATYAVIPRGRRLYSDPPGTNIPAPLPFINTPTDP
jgi:hypothetical protein